MDRFSEQLVERASDKKTAFLKGLVVAGAMLAIALLIMICIVLQYSITLFCVVAAAGVIWLAKFLWEGLNVEYEYIVTNDDLDIDKITGKRKRKRLMSVDLKSVDEFAPYLDAQRAVLKICPFYKSFRFFVTVLKEDYIIKRAVRRFL